MQEVMEGVMEGMERVMEVVVTVVEVTGLEFTEVIVKELAEEVQLVDANKNQIYLQ